MMLGRLGISLVLSIRFLGAQSSDALEIRGFVIEPGLGLDLGVAGAQVTLFEFGADPPHASERAVVTTASTDANGAFRFHPAHFGTYYVEVKKEGYFAKSFSGPTVAPANSTGDILTLDRDHAAREFRFSLMRMGEIRGRVIDEDGSPLGGVGLVVHAVSSDWLTSARVVTGKDGSFVAENLTPGDYLVRMLPQHGGLAQIVPQFSEGDLEVVDRDLESSEWPGGSEERNAIPLSLGSGAALSAGTITARTVPYYRVRVAILSGNCALGENLDFAAIPTSAPSGFAFPMKVPCGKDFLVRNLKPGSYWFSLSNGQKGEKYEWAFDSVEVTRGNSKVRLTMSPGVDLSGQIIAAEDGMPAPSGRTVIRMSPVIAAQSGQQATVDSAGRFVFKSLGGARHRISINGLTAKYYVKEIRYDGLPAADGFITPAPGAVLEIIIDDKPAILTGTVSGLDKPGSRVLVMAVRWPLARDQDGTFPFMSADAAGERQGKFQISGLAPGEYRVLALPPGGTSQTHMESFIRLEARAQAVTLDRGGSQDITIKLAEP